MLKNLPKAALAVSRLVRRTVAAASRIWLVLWAGSLWLTGLASARSLAAKFAALAGEVSLGELAGAVHPTAPANVGVCYYLALPRCASDAETSMSQLDRLDYPVQTQGRGKKGADCLALME